MKIVSQLLIIPIHFYRTMISPAFPSRCRYAPSCSQYAIDALRVHGPVKGLCLACWRLMRCNPWSGGGVDEVPKDGKWLAEEWIPPDDWAGNDANIVHPLPMGLDEEVCSEISQRNVVGQLDKNLPAKAGRPSDAYGVTNV